MPPADDPLEQPLLTPDPPECEAETAVPEDASADEVPPPVHRKSTLSSLREDVHIQDYTLIKRIGSGAYGEVWLAHSITGALRAVKIVWREDFELTKTFHREFLGIQQFEPISRGHPGLVHILHVGWNEERGFYYYVMELADDAVTGPHIEDLKAYTPRTLSSDMKHHGRLDLHFCQEAGAFIADALHYMHERGLTHRDIKPANIIYCGGICKLADIGLVAVSGERTFVGTEGFVPPEGPGTPQADLYSLGKVLYEMSSGKDRMEFPEVPDDIDDSEWPFWINFNHVICQACAPDLNERFQTGAQFADSLRAVTEQSPPTLFQKVIKVLKQAAMLVFTSFLAGGAWASYQHQQEWAWTVPLPQRPPPPSLLPESGKPWQSVYANWFSFKKDRHIADQPVDLTLFNRFLEATMRPFEGEVVPMQTSDKKTVYVVIVPAVDAMDFCEWMTQRERKAGRLTDGHEYAWMPYRQVNRPAGAPPTQPGWSAIVCEISKVTFGKLAVQSTPSPAQVFEGDTLLGQTPLSLARMRSGPLEIEVRYPGYKSEVLKGKVNVGQTLAFNVRLKNISAVIFGKPWENTLKMKLVSLGKAMIGVNEVRRRDYREFMLAKKLPWITDQHLEAEADLDKPVTFVTRAEATAFCEWLTEKEQATEIIDGNVHYRLPTDDEWSMAANLPREKGATPADRHLRIEGIYPWGFTWPPSPRSGNVFDVSAAKAANTKSAIKDYNDGQADVSVVGSFRSDWRGLNDLSGNAWEWVMEDYGGSDATARSHGTCRGGAYTTQNRQELLASFRRALPIDSRFPDVGFRIVLTDGRAARDDE